MPRGITMKKTAVLISVFAMLIAVGCKKEEKRPLAVAVNGIVNFTVGKVTIDNKGAVADAKPGDTISEGMKITTVGPKSIAEIYIGENALKITGNSSLVVARCAIVDGGYVTDLTVEKGGVFSKISKKLEKNDSFNVKTRTAVAAVRGTEFMVEDLESGSNIACVDGKVEVADAQNPEKSVTLDQKEEVTVQTGADLVKQQIASDKLRQLQILADIKDIQQDIKQKYEDQKADMRQQFEKQREEIRQAVVDQKAKDAEMVQKQKDDDAARVEAQKAVDKANIDAIKGTTDAAAADSVNAAKAAADATKIDTASAKTAADEQRASVKPEIKKTKIDPNQFKTQK